MVTIVDYGVGNLFSLQSSFAAIGVEAVLTSEYQEVAKAERIILPGVGAFEEAAKKLMESGFSDLIKQRALSGTPILGICLGMQLLFEKSYEYGEHQGLGLIPGEIHAISNVIPAELKIPHIGWNPLRFSKPDHPMFRYIKEGDCVYFVHSYYAAKCDDATIAVAEYGANLTAAVARGRVWGCQFHPEKSGNVGLNILRAFCEEEV